MPVQNDNLSPLPGLDFVFVEGGEFLMGSNEYGNEMPIHRVKVSSFYMGKYQVTQCQWQTITNENPSRFKGENRPVERVSWFDVQDFIDKLKKETGMHFRLPTEAEWEFAARGGIYSQGYAYAGSDKLKQVGWYDENSGQQTHDAGLLLANELGLHDMSGSVWEWCEDWFDEKYYEKCKEQGIIENPKGPEKGNSRVLRGGGCFADPAQCRPACRLSFTPDSLSDFVGFRLALSPS